MYQRLLLPALLLALATTGCKKDSEREVDGEWLFPIAKGTLSMNSMESLKNLKYHIEIPPQSLGQPTGTPVASPGLNIKHVGPFPIRITDWLKRLDVDTLSFSGTLKNVFPIPIGAGTKVVMRTSRDTTGNSNVAGAATIQSNVAPNQEFSFDVDVLHKTLNDSVFFFLEDFKSPPYSGVIFNPVATNLDITLKVITASLVQIYTNKSFVASDTVEFDAGEDDNLGSHTGGVLSDTSTTGVINIFSDNGLPAHANIQLYFLNEARTQILDSLFAPSRFSIEGGRTDGAGNPLYISYGAVKVPIIKAKLDRIKQAKWVVSNFNFNTIGYPGLFVTANKNPSLTVQLTGDLKLNIHF